MIRKLVLIALIVLSVGCGTCRQQVAYTRLGVESSLSVLAPLAPGVMGEERATLWLRSTEALLDAALAEWERSCEAAEQQPEPASAASQKCPLPPSKAE